MWKREFTGLGHVYRFTLVQQLKNRSNIISLVILLVLCLVSMPVMSLFGGDMNVGPEDFAQPELTAIVLDNQTSLPIEPLTDGIPVSTEPVAVLGDTAARVTITRDTEGYLIRTEGGAEVDAATLSQLGYLAQSWLQSAQLASAGVGPEEAAALTADVHYGYIGGMEDYLAPEEEAEDALGFDLRFLVTYIYAIIVMILCTYAATYIVRIIVEEKSSKLVELLMVSVQPLALVLGKILAMMTYIFGMFAAMALCIVLSMGINKAMGGEAAALSALSGFDFSLLRLDAGTIVIVIVSLLLAYAAFALLAGLAGTCCSRNEDVEAATGTVMFTVLAGYIVSCATGAIPASGLSIFLAVCPVVNVFCAPAQYVTGNIGLVWLIVSWVEQALIVAGLAWLTARVYRQLILSRGSRIKLRQLLAMAKVGKEAQA